SSGHTNSPHPSSREGHHSTVGWISGFLLFDLILCSSHAAATSLVHRKSVPSTQMRCMITAIRRASATIAFFIPRCLAIFIAQALSQDHFVERASMIWAASAWKIATIRVANLAPPRKIASSAQNIGRTALLAARFTCLSEVDQAGLGCVMLHLNLRGRASLLVQIGFLIRPSSPARCRTAKIVPFEEHDAPYLQIRARWRSDLAWHALPRADRGVGLQHHSVLGFGRIEERAALYL